MITPRDRAMIVSGRWMRNAIGTTLLWPTDPGAYRRSILLRANHR